MYSIKNIKNKLRQLDKGDLYCLIAFYLFWFVNTKAQLMAPSLSGYDSVTRLFNADQLLITVSGNTWLPLMQFFIRGINLFTSDLYVYKAFNYLVSTAAVTVYYFVIKYSFGRFLAIVSLVFFLMHVHWTGIATSVYMESLFLLNIALALLFLQRKRKILFSLFFIFATFSRPELLLAAPVIIPLVMLYQRSWLKGIQLAVLYLPVIAFYIWLKIASSDFEASSSFDLNLSLEVFLYLIDVYVKSYLYLVQGALAIGGAILLFTKSQLEIPNKRMLKYLAIGILTFVILYVLVVPVLHHALGSVGRKSLFLIMLSFLYVGISCQYLYQLKPNLAPYLISFLATLAICYGYYNADSQATWPYHTAQQISKKLSDSYKKEDIHYICDLKDVDSQYSYVKGILINQILFYLNQDDWKFEFINCNNKSAWRRFSKGSARATLIIYDKYSLDPRFFSNLSKQCSTTGVIKKYGKVIGRYCF